MTVKEFFSIGLMTAEYVRGTSEQSRNYRRNILRYCELAQVLVFRDISMRARRRFPTLDTVVAAGFSFCLFFVFCRFHDGP